MRHGRFRQDLYYRLKVIELKLPPLRERREDIRLLATHYLHQFAARHNKAVKDIEAAAMRALINFDWPGNIRQLIHVIEQAVVLAETEKLTLFDLPSELHESVASSSQEFELGEASFSEIKVKVVADFETNIINRALSQTEGNVSQAARLLKMKRQFLQAKMKDLGIERRQFL